MRVIVKQRDMLDCVSERDPPGLEQEAAVGMADAAPDAVTAAVTAATATITATSAGAVVDVAAAAGPAIAARMLGAVDVAGAAGSSQPSIAHKAVNNKELQGVWI